MSVIAIVQARMNSTRLPGKVMKPLVGYTVLQTICERVAAAKRVDRVIVATSMNKPDVAISRACYDMAIPYFRGSEDDVLDRVYQAAVAFQADYIVDITADCPLVDPVHIDRIVSELVGTSRSYQPRDLDNSCFDYVSNCWQREWPDGLDVQAYTFNALEKIWKSKTSVREHVGWNIPEQAGDLGLNCRQICAPKRYRHPEWGLTLDEPQDYDLLKRLFFEAVLAHGNHLFPVEWVLDYLLKHDDMLGINKDVTRKTPGGIK